MTHHLSYKQSCGQGKRTALKLQQHFRASEDYGIGQEILTWFPLPTEEYLRIVEVWHKARAARTKALNYGHVGLKVVLYHPAYRVKSWWENRLMEERKDVHHQVVVVYNSAPTVFKVEHEVLYFENVEAGKRRCVHCPFCGISMTISDDFRMSSHGGIVVSCDQGCPIPICTEVKVVA